MKNFKETAEKCLAGELSGRFVCRDGLHISSFTLSRTDNPLYPYKLYRAGKLTKNGLAPNKYSQNDIIQFIPYEEMKPEQITIDIPEGKVPVMEQTEKGVVITWKEKEITYADVVSKLVLNQNAIYEFWSDKIHEGPSKSFYKKVEVLRKLTNIRNYFGKPNSYDRGYCICYGSYTNKFYARNINTIGIWTKDIVFTEKEHAEQAIKMLGDELKYLLEPW
jgi:hypothetical protein